MSEGDRKNFHRHLREEGYADGEIPKGLELIAAIRSFTDAYIAKKMA